MLAPAETPDFKTLKFPLLGSVKLDGIRATMQGGTLLSRTLKPIPNKFVQELSRSLGLPDGLDGELICGNPFQDPYKRTHSIVMSDDKPLDFYGDTVRWNVFDKYDAADGFQTRHARIYGFTHLDSFVVPVSHVMLHSIAELEAFERETLALGYEGVMLRSVDGPYKQGRATLNQGWLMKVKRYQQAEALIMEAYEEQENTNEEFTNELGRTARSSAKAGKVGKGQLGGFHVVGQGAFYNGIDFDISSSSITHEERKELWEKRDELKGKLLTYKFFPMGSDVRPRHPVFKWFRDRRDV
jgi:DNA ligase-1